MDFDVHLPTSALEWLLSDDDTAPESERLILRALDFVDDSGRRTDGGSWSRRMLRPSETNGVRVDQADASEGSVLLVGVSGRLALVAAQREPQEWALSVVGSSAVPNIIARYVELTPSDVVDKVDRALSFTELAAALERVEPSIAANDASVVDALLCSRWTRLTIRTSDGASAEFARVETWGIFELSPTDDGVELLSVSSAEFFSMLTEVTAATAGVGAPVNDSA